MRAFGDVSQTVSRLPVELQELIYKSLVVNQSIVRLANEFVIRCFKSRCASRNIDLYLDRIILEGIDLYSLLRSESLHDTYNYIMGQLYKFYNYHQIDIHRDRLKRKARGLKKKYLQLRRVLGKVRSITEVEEYGLRR